MTVIAMSSHTWKLVIRMFYVIFNTPKNKNPFKIIPYSVLSPHGSRNFLREFWPVYGVGVNPAS